MTGHDLRMGWKRKLLFLSLILSVFGLSEYEIYGYNSIMLTYIGFPTSFLIIFWIWLMQG
jgi:hypothetical protein